MHAAQPSRDDVMC